MKKSFRFSAVGAIVAVAAMVFATGAQAQAVFGQIAPGGTPEAECATSGFDLLQNEVTDGALYEAPAEGVITSWSTNAAKGAGQSVTFKVFRTIDNKVHRVIAHDTQTLTSAVVNTFKVHIPVKSGDEIGLNTGNASPQIENACLFTTGNEHDGALNFEEDVADNGQTRANPFEAKKVRVNVSATLLAPPSIRVDSRGDLGSIAGGKTISLTGFNFSEVSKVSFGGVPARKFTVASETQLSAVVPPGKTLNEISIFVTTPAGTAETPDVFSYRGCVVPKLKHKTLKAAKARLRAAGCKLGRVSGRRSGKVVKQTPRQGTLVAPGSKVSVKLGR